MLAPGKTGLHGRMHAPESVVQFGIGIAGKGVQLTHHLIDGRAHARSKRPHGIHAERMPPGEQGFRFAHALQRRLVGGKQPTETRAPLPQAGLERLLAGQRLGVRLRRAAPQQIA